MSARPGVGRGLDNDGRVGTSLRAMKNLHRPPDLRLVGRSRPPLDPARRRAQPRPTLAAVVLTLAAALLLALALPVTASGDAADPCLGPGPAGAIADGDPWPRRHDAHDLRVGAGTSWAATACPQPASQLPRW